MSCGSGRTGSCCTTLEHSEHERFQLPSLRVRRLVPVLGRELQAGRKVLAFNHFVTGFRSNAVPGGLAARSFLLAKFRLSDA